MRNRAAGKIRSVVIAGMIGLLLAAPCVGIAAAPKRTVLMFIVDGLQTDAAKIAMTHGAVNMKFLFDNGVWVEEAYCSSPSGRLYLPDNSMPWGTAAPPNVAMHTGTHVFESRQMDDIFLAGRRAGIKSLFAGSAENYKVFNTADFCHAASNTDSLCADFAIDHLRKDGVRLLSLHVQETRRHWKGPEDKTKPESNYQGYLLTVDRFLGKLIQALKSEGVWDSTYVIVSSDHGMGVTDKSDHPASVVSSWMPYMNFYGPGIKKGATIPYAETPDLAVLIRYLLNLPPLQGHLDNKVSVEPRGVTGTLLANIFDGNPTELWHPRLVRRYLESRNWKASDDFADYRTAMLGLIKECARGNLQKRSESKIIHRGTDGRLVYEPINELGDRIIDFSNVGYMGGGVAIPEVPVVLTLAPVSNSTDDWERIQSAIDNVAAMTPDSRGIRGALLLRKGRYVCSKTLRIGASGIVLRGEGNGEDGTCLYDDLREQNSFIVVSGTGSLQETPNTRVDIMDEYVPIGSRVVHVSDGTRFSVGDTVGVYRPGTKEWLHVLGTDNLPKDFPRVKDWTPEYYSLCWERTIVAVNGNEITLDAPIVDALNRTLGKSYLYKCSFPGRIGHVGVENIKFDSYFDPTVKLDVTLELIRDGLNGIRPQTDLPKTFADEKHGWSAVEIDKAENCWVRNATSVHFGFSCVRINSSGKYVTVQDCAFLDPVSEIVGGRRYSFYVDGQLNLVQRCFSRSGRHDFVLTAKTRGPNVFFDCTGEESWSMTEAHHRWSQGGLWDNVVSQGPWSCMQAVNRSSSGTGHGWPAVNMVFWNCDARFIFIQKPPTGQNFLIGRNHTTPYVYLRSPQTDFDEMMEWIEFHAKKKFTYAAGATVVGDGYIESPYSPVTPKSLYLTQLRDRLGAQAVRNILTDEQKQRFSVE
jgi:hypothetical protein